MRLPEHGSNPQHLFNALNISKREQVIDFSVNVNPYGMPHSIKEQWSELLAHVSDYPDPQAASLKAAIAHKESLHMEQIVIGNGAAQLIFLLANQFRKRAVLIVDPTFSEYRTACHAFDCPVHSFQLSEENGWQLTAKDILPHLDGKAALFICNPNNPTGVHYEKDEMLTIIKEAYKRKVTVVIDEAFYDFCERPYTLVPYVSTYANLVVLRSFTKMYAIAGIRLGWLAASASFCEKIAKFQPHWSVNAIAEQIGMRCLQEEQFVKETVEKVTEERKRMVEKWRELHFVPTSSVTNYYLVRDERKRPLHSLLRFLMKEGFVARHTENFIGLDGNYLRFAVRTAEENDQLISTVKRWRKQCLSS